MNHVENHIISRIARQEARSKARDIDSMFKPFGKSLKGFSQTTPHAKNQSPVLQDIGGSGHGGSTVFQPPRDNRTVFETDKTLRQFFCFHGKAKIFKGTKHGCKICG